MKRPVESGWEWSLLSDRGFRYGMQVFETVLVRNGRSVFAREHLERLLAACGDLGMDVRAEDVALAREYLSVPPVESGVLRLHVSAGEGGLTDPIWKPRWGMAWERRPPLELPVAPARLMFSEIAAAPFPLGLKTGNYWRHVAAQSAAVAAGFTDALMFDADGSLVCCATGNVLVRVEGRWLTPHAGTGRRKGVVLAWLEPRLDARPAVITRRELIAADEILVCNSWWGPRPAESLEGRVLGGGGSAGQVIKDYWAVVDGGA